MMLFASNAGRIVRVNGPASAADMRYFSTPGDELTERTALVIVTRVASNEEVEAQITRAGNPIYVVISGDRPGTVTISGMAFAGDCEQSDRHGAANVVEWFRRNKASQRDEPLTIVLADRTISGLGIGNGMDTIDPATGVVQFNLTITTFPED